jgi:hypothetical protein
LHHQKKKKIHRQIVNNACKRKAIDDLFSRPKKVIPKKLEQISADCSNVDDTNRQFYYFIFWRKMVKNYFYFFLQKRYFFFGGKWSRPLLLPIIIALYRRP